MSHVKRVRSDGALVLRPTRELLPGWSTRWGIQDSEAATVRLVAGAAGPLGGDHFRLDVTVAEGAVLMLGAAAATLILPGASGGESLSEVNISVGEGGTLMWTPGPQIAALDCHHKALSRVTLARGARLYLREELVLGRHGELPGQFHQRLRVTVDGTPLYDQELAVGPQTPGWSGAAVTGGRRSLGTIILVDSSAQNNGTPVEFPSDTAVMRLSENSTLISSVAPDAIELRHRLAAAFAEVINPAVPAALSAHA